MHQTPLMDWLKKHLFKSVDLTYLVYFRIAFGGLMLWEAIRYLASDRIYRYYIEPKYLFHFYNLDFIKPIEGNGMYMVFGFLGLCALLIAIGLFYRWATIGLFISFTYIFLLDQTRYLNHFYLLSLISLLMIFIPVNKDFSIDAIRKPSIRANTLPAWCQYILMFQISCAYFFGGVAKLNFDWLHGEPLRMWLARRMDFPLIGQYFKEEWMVYFLSYSGLIFDLLIVPLLFWRKSRTIAFVFAAFFHLLNDQLFLIGIFPWFMLASTAILFFDFWPPIWRKLQWFSGSPASTTLSKSYAFPLVIIYILIQLFLPMRHLFYPGNPSWTEEGHKFAWHMKLRSKIGYCRFFIEDKFSAKAKEISPGFFLTETQNRKMAGNPEMILQFSHFLEKELASQDIRNIKVKVKCFSSLNNRKMQLLVDSNIDLAAQQNTWRHYEWIIPLSEPLQIPKK